MDNKELIDNLKTRTGSSFCGDCGMCGMCDKAISAIKTMQAERDAALADLTELCEENPDTCHLCKHMPCTEKYGRCIGWQWRGLKKKEA